MRQRPRRLRAAGWGGGLAELNFFAALLEAERRAGLGEPAARVARATLGWAEVALAIVLLIAWRRRWPLWLTLVLMPIALAPVALTAPGFLAAAFNPVSLNACVFALATVALLNTADLPTASRCVRTPPREAP